MASTVLTRTPSSNGSQRIMTFSTWLKRGGLGGKTFFSTGSNSTNVFGLYFTGADLLQQEYYNGSTNYYLRTNRKFRDTNAWYHLVLTLDTTDATQSNRMRIYVNGVEETSFDAAFYPTQNFDVQYLNSTSYQNNVGNYVGSSYFDGELAHTHFIDGTVYTPSTFGETDSETGIWKPKTNPSVTYGTNGFFLKFENSASMGTDSSGNSNNFTVGGGTLTQTIDTPSNVFATMNPLDNFYSGYSFSNGNTTVALDNINERYVLGNLGMSSGKYYFEAKYVTKSGDTYSKIGIESIMKNASNGYEADSYGYRGEPVGYKVNNGTFTTWGNSYTTGDIIGVAVDLDNNYIYFSKNGTWQESGDPTSGSSGTGAAFSLGTPSSGFYFPAVGKEDGDTCTWSFNFGNGYFGTTAVSSAQNPDDGIGIFEYDVPTGYRALCTKSINAQEYS